MADQLLPDTHLALAYRDSKCDPTVGFTEMLALVRESFGGSGVNAIVGAGCSGTTILAAQVASAARVPIISPSSTSPALSQGKLYPFFVRTAPSASFKTAFFVDAVRNLWNYTAVALVSATDACMHRRPLSAALCSALSPLTLRSPVHLRTSVLSPPNCKC